MSEKPLKWAEPADEYREIARDCAKMGRPDLALQFLSLAQQEERQKNALAAIFGHPS